MELFVAQHGETLHSLTQQLAEPEATLTALGKEQALSAAHDLAGKIVFAPIDRIITSPRERTMQAATIIAAFFRIAAHAIEVDKRLIERDLSPFVGQNRHTVLALSEQELEAGGAEPLQEFRQRNADALYDAARECGRTVLMTHAGNIPHLYAATETLEPDLTPARVGALPL